MSTEDNKNQNTENHRRVYYRLVRYKKVSTSYNKFLNLSIVIFPVGIILILLISGGIFEGMFNGGGSNTPTIPDNPTEPPTEPYQSDIILTTIYGQTIRLADHQGKVVIIYFFGTHCPGCPDQASILANIDDIYTSNQLYIVPICLDTTAETSNSELDDWLEGYDPNWPVMRDTVEYTYASYFNIMVKPTVKILDINGNIEATMVGTTQGSFNNIKTQVDALL
ncbi:MAG: TlpA family protein disulfide reductase [Candidatus Lokiarchaeota archaeon]|nr:TlpA family protein disulfide reductase [Candidatus Lokiarchaeota archaeon]